MAIAAAEQLKQPTAELLHLDFTESKNQELMGVIDVAELPDDEELKKQARLNLMGGIVGDIAVSETVASRTKPIKNLLSGLKWAKEGDQEGQRMVHANVMTEAIERVLKAGNIKTVKLESDSEKNIYQHGQKISDVHRNAYQMASDHPVIKSRTIAEANNSERIKRHLKEDDLKDNVFVVFSMCAEGLSDKELDKLNFFSLTKSMSVQGTFEEEGGLKTETAFIAGVKDEDSDRHDRRMVEKFGDMTGVNYKGKTASQIIDMPVLVPKELIPNGVSDIVKILDDLNGGTFYGQAKPRQDYQEFKKFCEQREKSFDKDIQSVKNQLIDEANILKSPLEAIKRLGKLVEAKMVSRALIDRSIEPIVFGAKSAKNLEQARQLRARGDHNEAQAFLQVAIATATGGSCPAVLNKELAKALGIIDMSSTGEITADRDDLGSRNFECSKGHKNYRNEPNIKETKCQHKGCDGNVGC